jgi:hypothetical protein
MPNCSLLSLIVGVMLRREASISWHIERHRAMLGTMEQRWVAANVGVRALSPRLPC